MKKLKKKKKELKEEVAKLRGAVPVQHIADDHDASTPDDEIVEEAILLLSAACIFPHSSHSTKFFQSVLAMSIK